MNDPTAPPRRPYLDAQIDGKKALVLILLFAVLAAWFWFVPAT